MLFPPQPTKVQAMVQLYNELITAINTLVSPSSSGSIGTDYSANKPAVPGIGLQFPASGPYASYVLVTTVPASVYLFTEIENNSGGQIVIILDDGTAAAGAAPVNYSIFPLAGGLGSGSQGGSWQNSSERGRIQVYAPITTAQVKVRTN
jgi:hypothetical protein